MYINLSSIIFIKVTSFLDGSVIYGSSREEAEELRLFTGGLLRYNNAYLYLPGRIPGRYMTLKEKLSIVVFFLNF